MNRILITGCLFVALGSAVAKADTIIDFEQYGNNTTIKNQYLAQGVKFSNALQKTAPSGDYNSIDFPPHSGAGVVINDPSAIMTITFTAVQNEVSGWFSAGEFLTISAYDFDGAFLGSVYPAGGYHVSSSWDIMATNIKTLQLKTNDADEFALDDLTFNIIAKTPVDTRLHHRLGLQHRALFLNQARLF